MQLRNDIYYNHFFITFETTFSLILTCDLLIHGHNVIGCKGVKINKWNYKFGSESCIVG